MTLDNNVLMKADQVNTFIGLSHILYDVSLQVNTGEVMCLLGRNGAGKTTLIRTLCGLAPPKSGAIVFLDKDISGLPAYMLARKGIIAAFSERRVFGNLTVKENLEISHRKTDGDKTKWDLPRVYNLFPILREFETKWAQTLSGGQQQMLCIAKSLMGNPKVLMLDEPTIGLAPVVVRMIGEQINALKTEGMSILLTEQNVKFAVELGDFFYIIDTGEIQFSGDGKSLKENKDYVERYLAV